MIEKIHIENFRSLRNIDLNLQKVNLLIGPNNSGKSNFLKAVKFWGKPYVSDAILFKKAENNIVEVKVKPLNSFSAHDYSISNYKIGDSKQLINSYFVNEGEVNEARKYVEKVHLDVEPTFLPLYSIDISKIKQASEVQPNIYTLNDDCSNIVSFLDNMRDERQDIILKIEQDLKRCVKEFTGIRFKKIKNGDKYTYKKIGLTTENGDAYWAEDLSDGTLYFLALLCIVHQPNPPEILLLEEPENGIHPRRIKEMLDYIFDLAEDKNIQVVMTTHNTYVIDQFKDIPEAIFVFDKEGDETKVRNLQDIINEDAAKAAKDGMPKMDLTGSLGDHWASGLIGGVPI